MLLALDGRTLWAAVLLGVAVGCKSWALVAVAPVLLAMPRRRLRAAIVAGACAATLVAPIAIGATGNFRAETSALSTTGIIFQPWQAWWWLGKPAQSSRRVPSSGSPPRET